MTVSSWDQGVFLEQEDQWAWYWQFDTQFSIILPCSNADCPTWATDMAREPAGHFFFEEVDRIEYGIKMILSLILRVVTWWQCLGVCLCLQICLWNIPFFTWWKVGNIFNSPGFPFSPTSSVKLFLSFCFHFLDLLWSEDWSYIDDKYTHILCLVALKCPNFLSLRSGLFINYPNPLCQ
jgi:hypothetical protein